MVKLKLGETEYPLVLTVGALDSLAVRGVTIENLFQFYSVEHNSFAEAVEHGLELLDILAECGCVSVSGCRIGDNGPLPDMGIVRQILTPGQVWGLCDAAILAGLKRTVEADHSKNADSAV